MSFRDIQTTEDVINYQKRLTDGYPDRPKIIQQIIKTITQLKTEKLKIVELCVGPGQLAMAICNAVPQMKYVGLDFMKPFLDFTAETLAADHVDASFVQADLTGNEWPSLLTEAVSAPFDVIVSMQSLHDVGGAESTANIYKQSQRLLHQGGIFINADLITKVGEEENARPGRLTVPNHLELLDLAEFTQTICSFQNDHFAVCIGEKL